MNFHSFKSTQYNYHNYAYKAIIVLILFCFNNSFLIEVKKIYEKKIEYQLSSQRKNICSPGSKCVEGVLAWFGVTLNPQLTKNPLITSHFL
jgi:hypothetical protein